MDEKPYINYTKEAFSLPANLGFLAVAFLSILTSAILGMADIFPPLVDPTFFTFGLVFITAALESLFLALAPDNERFQRAINAKYADEYSLVENRLQSMQFLLDLGPAFMDKYLAFYQKKLTIIENIQRNPSIDSVFSITYLDKLNQLEANYVRLLHGSERYVRSKDAVSRPQIEEEIRSLQDKIRDSKGKLKEEYEKRIIVLIKRQKRSDQSQNDLQIARVQLDTIEDTIDYILEQSIVIKNPSEISRVVDSVIQEAESHRDTIEEIEALFADEYSSIAEEEMRLKGNMNAGPIL